jgi:hypothetical protein
LTRGARAPPVGSVQGSLKPQEEKRDLLPLLLLLDHPLLVLLLLVEKPKWKRVQVPAPYVTGTWSSYGGRPLCLPCARRRAI